MWNLVRAELLKLRRCPILFVGLTAMALCPLVQYGSQLILSPEYREPGYDLSSLFENVIWGNTQIFLPISLVMTGGWIIDRENAQDTLKNIATVPVSMPEILGAKLILTGFLALFLGIFSAGAVLVTGLTAGLSGFTGRVLFCGSARLILAALTASLACMPLILIFGQRRGAYLGGSVLAFFLGYSMMFFKGGILSSLYPFSASLILAGFDMSGYAGTTAPPDLFFAAAGEGLMALWTLLLIRGAGKKKEGWPGTQKQAGRKPGRKRGSLL